MRRARKIEETKQERTARKSIEREIVRLAELLTIGGELSDGEIAMLDGMIQRWQFADGGE